MLEREDWEAPSIPPPVQLTHREAQIVYNEIERGAEDWKLAEYFMTDITHVRAVHASIKRYKTRMALLQK